MVEVIRDNSDFIISVDGYAVPNECKSKNLNLFEHLGIKLDLDDGKKIYTCRRDGCSCCNKIFWEHRNKKYGKFSWLKIKPYKKADGKVYWKSRYGNERRLAPNQLKRVKRVWERHNKPMHLEVKA